ncbi:hypothetical protein TNIN_303431 [Trichonephila inaurata madagascariensis]|uniref:C2H2-type domain-containing protein n=1 Tax=Trichonephila inaurata madagascariensis TaxID=2747483 RepID=A0A8X6WNH8_9ARAC|nr:hypothetical protein TNIN_303431 [Trichonephila inaurata madagascariensis]
MAFEENRNLNDIASNDGFPCMVCNERFPNRSILEKHYFKHIQRCRSCGKVHEIGRLGQCRRKRRNKYIICKCNVGFPTKSSYATHVCPYTTGKRYKCDMCENEYKSLNGLKMHYILHSSPPYVICSVCDKHFRSNVTLKRHMLTHSGEKKYVCELCNQRFTLKNTLKNHYLTHTGEKPYMCEFCGRRFSKGGNLHTHYRTHTNKDIASNVG